ncbi:MAG TPA: FAD-dependent oxidoreductase [Polyangiaceae bacterium]|jgi:phytoene dehydrogenase-like protein
MAGIIADVAVVGGGLGGLASAALLARRGLDVVVLERASEPGGRAATHVHDGYRFNLGAHALYLGGAAARVLGGLGVAWSGKAPPSAGVAVLGGRTHALPLSAGSLLTTGLLGWSAKVQGGRLMARLGSIDTRALRGVPLRAWLDENVTEPVMRATFEAFARVTTYTSAPSLLDAGAAIAQIRQGQRPGVVYLDGGWQTLVDGVAGAARAAGARVHAGAHVTCAAPGDGGWSVSLAGSGPVACRALVLATGPAAARSIVASDALAAWADRAIPVKTACLDVALSRLPDERTTFALGVDRPLYFSVHSRSARVAPPGAALVSTMKYLSPTAAPDAARDEAELEGLLDLLQPGWRDVLVERRWLPGMIASNALVTATGGGLAGRPGPGVPDAPGAFVVGDWVGGEGMLLDASLASAEQAAAAVGDALAVAKVA